MLVTEAQGKLPDTHHYQSRAHFEERCVFITVRQAKASWCCTAGPSMSVWVVLVLARVIWGNNLATQSSPVMRPPELV